MRLFYAIAFVSVLSACSSGGDSPSNTDVTDSTPPVISINGNTEITVEFGTDYTDQGATALDNADGDVAVTVNGTVDTSKVGSYPITYSATDSSNNTSSATRKVNVVDTAAPVITLTGDADITVEFGTTYKDQGATALDNADGNIPVTVNGTADTSKVGSYPITYSATDSSNNTSSATRKVNVVDTAAPVITLTGDADITVEFGTTYKDQGATALDNADGNIPVKVDGTVNTSKAGSYELVFTATDSSNNSTSVNRTVTVLEKITTIAGKVIDGYISGATVWLDYNGNGKFDAQTEPSTVSGEAGNYSFDFTDEQKQCLPYTTMYVDVPAGAIDEDSGVVTQAYQMALPPSIEVMSDEELRNISPLTSIIWELLRSQLQESGRPTISCSDLLNSITLRDEIKSNLESVILNAVAHYNLSEKQMFSDFILNDNSEAYDAAQEIVKGLKAAFKHSTDLNKQYPNAQEIRVIIYQSKSDDELYNLNFAWYRKIVIFLKGQYISEKVKLKGTEALDQVDYVLTKLESIDTPWGDQTYKGVLRVRNDIYVNDDLTYRCGITETVKLEKDGATYEISNSIPSVSSPTFESCTANNIENPYERSFRVRYTLDGSDYFGVFFFREDKAGFNSLPTWINVTDKADDLNPNDVFTYMNTLPYEFDTDVDIDASYWRKRKITGEVWIDQNNDNEWVRTTRLEDNTLSKECSNDGINWGTCP